VKHPDNFLLKQKTYVVYSSTTIGKSLSSLCHDLLEEQKLQWQQLAEGYAALKTVQIRNISCNGFHVSVQFNPKRIRSTEANLDPKVIHERRCFLCLDHLPEPQKGILYHGEFLLLCNPVPIFTRHFTCVNIHHIPQELEPSLALLLDLAKDLHSEYTVFYNGPQCGASAPDHLHFQISPWRSIPIESDAVSMSRRKRLYYQQHCAVYELVQYGRSVIIIESTTKELLLELLKKTIAGWKNLLATPEEPMMNLLCSYQEDIWRCILLPRKKHRPDIFFKEGEDRVLISPAAVDMGGFIVTPLEKDFVHLHSTLVETIFAEVSMPPDFVQNIIKTIE
jgi:hypothetical protein